MKTRFVLALLFTAACGGSPSPQPTTTPLPPPPTTQPADPHHVTAETTYEGDCMPAGSRGGCHTVTLRTDGTYRNFLFDAVMEGTYSIDGDVLTMNGPSNEPIKMTFSEDRSKLDNLVLKP